MPMDLVEISKFTEDLERWISVMDFAINFNWVFMSQLVSRAGVATTRGSPAGCWCTRGGGCATAPAQTENK